MKILNVAGNKIEKLPESLGTLIRCEEMDFSKNQIFELPGRIKFTTIKLENIGEGV